MAGEPAGTVDDSARRMRSLHSDSVRMLSITAAKWSVYSGKGGSVLLKLIRRHWAVDGADAESKCDSMIATTLCEVGIERMDLR